MPRSYRCAEFCTGTFRCFLPQNKQSASTLRSAAGQAPRLDSPNRWGTRCHFLPCHLLLITEPGRQATPDPQMPSGRCCGRVLCWGFTPKELSHPGQQYFGTQHFPRRSELAGRLISRSHDLLLKFAFKWKYVKLKSFICLLSFSTVPFPQDRHMLNALYERLMSTSETRNEEAGVYTEWIRFPTEMSFVSSRFWIFAIFYTWMGPEGWVTAVKCS